MSGSEQLPPSCSPQGTGSGELSSPLPVPTHPKGCQECGEPFGFHLPFCGLRQSELRAQGSPWSCLPTAFAMCMGKEPAEAINFLGRDDSRGFHQLELVWWAKSLGFIFLPWEEPRLEPGKCLECPGLGDVVCPKCGGGDVVEGIFTVPPLKELLGTYDGVLVGRVGNNDHAACWRKDHQKVFDPNYTTYGIEKFEVEIFWALVK